MRPFSLLIKPAAADCNLRCEYCFYLDKCRLYPETAHHRMTQDVLEKLVKGYMATPQPVYSFGWQGGEPLLMGLDFFRKITALQQQYGKKGDVVSNGLQTNATLIDDALADHLSRYRFLLGCSLDGPANVHNRYRRTAGGKTTHAEVLKGMDILKRHGVEVNVLVLVSQANVGQAVKIYDYLVDRGYHYHQYIPCVEFDSDGNLLPFAINGVEWGDFLCRLFDRWYARDTRRVSIRHFDAILHKVIQNSIQVCSLGRNCCQYFVVEYNGDIYPCDFFVEKGLKIGNIKDTSWEEAMASPVYKDFGAQKACWNHRCRNCDCLPLCSGDCLKHRLYAGHDADNISWLCSGWKQFIRYSRDGFHALAEILGQPDNHP
jgi:serine-type anaerobic sulfatase-maturating enzyme